MKHFELNQTVKILKGNAKGHHGVVKGLDRNHPFQYQVSINGGFARYTGQELTAL